MSEVVPLPEQPKPEKPAEPKEKVQTTCWSCGHVVTSSLANCLTTIFSKQPWNSYTALGCLDTKCQAVTILFHDMIPKDSIAKAVKYPTTTEEFCDQEDILEVRRTLLRINDIETHDLSLRQDRIIEHWGQFLQTITVDVTDFPEVSDV